MTHAQCARFCADQQSQWVPERRMITLNNNFPRTPQIYSKWSMDSNTSRNPLNDPTPALDPCVIMMCFISHIIDHDLLFSWRLICSLKVWWYQEMIDAIAWESNQFRVMHPYLSIPQSHTPGYRIDTWETTKGTCAKYRCWTKRQRQSRKHLPPNKSQNQEGHIN